MAAALMAPTAEQLRVCDVNRTGMIDILDARLIAQHAAGPAVLLPCAPPAPPTQAQWTQVFPATSPAARIGSPLVYDAAREEVVLFGGNAGTVTELADTWVWDGTAWSERFPAQSPPARSVHPMAYDRARAVTVLHGGLGRTVPPWVWLGDTWLWDGIDWQQAVTPVAPDPRVDHGMAYDDLRREVVLHGGLVEPGLHPNDTWAWDGASWTQRTPATAPGQVVVHSMLGEPTRGRALLFLGNILPLETWAWDGADWAELATDGPTTAHDPTWQVTVSHDGGSSCMCQEEWMLRDTTWSPLPTTGARPTADHGHSMTYDEARGVFVLFGGFGNGTWLDETWILELQ